MQEMCNYSIIMHTSIYLFVQMVQYNRNEEVCQLLLEVVQSNHFLETYF